MTANPASTRIRASPTWVPSWLAGQGYRRPELSCRVPASRRAPHRKELLPPSRRRRLANCLQQHHRDRSPYRRRASVGSQRYLPSPDHPAPGPYYCPIVGNLPIENVRFGSKADTLHSATLCPLCPLKADISVTARAGRIYEYMPLMTLYS